MINKKVTIKNKAGLHARPATLFVQTANKYKSKIGIEKQGKRVNAKSIMGVMSLAICCDDKIIIYANGEDENEAIKNLVELIEDKFCE